MARTVILGNGGHAAVLRWALQKEYADVLSVESDDEVQPDDWLFIGFGDMERRREKFEKFGRGRFPIFIDQLATVREDRMGWGCQIITNAVVQVGCIIGHNVLINTGAQLDHHCRIGDHTIIGPGAILCGNVHLGEACEIGAGAIIVQGVTLVAETKIPAGSLVVAPDDIRRPRRI